MGFFFQKLIIEIWSSLPLNAGKATNSNILHQMKLAISSQGLSNLNTLTNNSYLIGCNAVN